MNIQHFSSLDAILIDADSYSLHEDEDRLSPHSEQSPIRFSSTKLTNYETEKNNESSQRQDSYDEESFEHESHVITNKSYSQDEASNEEDKNENYENTFDEPTSGIHSHRHHGEEGEDQYENTFEAEYSHSVVDQSAPSPSNKNTISNLNSPEMKLSQAVSSMSGIKPTENIKTFEDLVMMSTPSSSSHSSPRVDNCSPRVDPSPIQTPLFVQQQPPRNKFQMISHSSESAARIQSSHIPYRTTSSNPENAKSSAPKLFSKVRILSEDEIQKLRLKQESKTNHKQPLPSSKSRNEGRIDPNGNIDPWNFSTEDLETMKRAKAILEKIEGQQKSLQDQQIHRLASRKSVIVQNLDLGRRSLPSCASPPPRSNDSIDLNPPSSLDSQRNAFAEKNSTTTYSDPVQKSNQLIGLSDDDGVYPTSDGDTDELSLESILSGHEDYRKYKPSTKRGHQARRNSRDRLSVNEERAQSSKQRFDTNSSIDSESQVDLEELAEQTYFNFLADLVNSSRSRSLTASVEELAMHRVLSERIYSYFAQPNLVKLLRKEMIVAAKDTRSSYGKISNRR